MNERVSDDWLRRTRDLLRNERDAEFQTIVTMTPEIADELLTLRARVPDLEQLARDVAAKNPGWYDDILHTYVCLFCELTNPDIEQLEPVSQHDPECAYRRAVALTQGASEP